MKKLFLFLLFSMFLFCAFSQNHFSTSSEARLKHQFFGLRLGAGLDPLIIPNGLAGIYFMPISNDKFRVALDNLVAVSIPWMVYTFYYYPSIRLSIKHQKVWLGASYGKEFSTVTDLFDNHGEKVSRVINHRIDLGVAYEINRYFDFEWSIPVRIDDEIPIYLTGINATFIYKF